MIWYYTIFSINSMLLVQWVSVVWNPLLLNLRNIYDTLKPIIPVESLGSKYQDNYFQISPLE